MKEMFPGMPESVFELLLGSINREVSVDPLENVMYKKIFQAEGDKVINKMVRKSKSVYHGVIAFRFLKPYEKELLWNQFNRKADDRFSDNLLGTMSWIRQYNNKEEYERELVSLRRITAIYFPELRR